VKGVDPVAHVAQTHPVVDRDRVEPGTSGPVVTVNSTGQCPHLRRVQAASG
jgi:hypothetical protein